MAKDPFANPSSGGGVDALLGPAPVVTSEISSVQPEKPQPAKKRVSPERSKPKIKNKPVEDGAQRTTQLNVAVDPATKKALKLWALEQDTDLAALVRNILKEAIPREFKPD